MSRTGWKIVVALGVAGASELMPIPGMMLAFPLGGIHGDHPEAYFYVALILNFFSVFWGFYWLMGKIVDWVTPANARDIPPNPAG